MTHVFPCWDGLNEKWRWNYKRHHSWQQIKHSKLYQTCSTKATCSSARSNERLASLVTQAKSCWRSDWTDWSLKRRRSSLKNRQASEQDGAPHQIFNLRIRCKKHLQHQHDPYHAFIDFKKAFNRVWHAALWRSTTSRQPCLSHQTPLWQGHQCSPLQQQHRRLAPNNSWSPRGISTLTHPLQKRIMTSGIMKTLPALEAEQSPISILLMTLLAWEDRKKNGQN